MRKLILLFVMTVNALFICAKVEYDINKYGVMMVSFVSDTDSLSTEQFRLDWLQAIEIATKEKKVKQVQLKDSKGDIIGWSNINNLYSLNKILEKVIYEFKDFDEFENIYGDSVKTSITTPAQYHSDTYKNGVEESSYSSDWTSGYFAPKTSTYRSGGDTYTTKTYYTPQKIEYRWERQIKGRKIVRSGERFRLSQIYKVIK
jgi:hypothetical protein